jgi:hypothetical protein
MGDLEWGPGIPSATGQPNYFPAIHIGSKSFKDTYQLALTIVHEAFHGYYDHAFTDEASAEATAVRCVI